VFSRVGGDLAVDLGTANTVVFVEGEGVVLSEPSVIAIDERSGSVLAVGAEARRMIGRTPAAIRALRPLRSGVITDFEVTEQMLRHFLRATVTHRQRRPRVMLCVPSGLTGIERDAVEQATLAAGAAKVQLIEEPLAAAIGADLPVSEPAGCMIVDIGGGTTEVAVLALGGMVVWRSLRLGGYEMDDAIVARLRQEHKLLIGDEQAEQLKINLGHSGQASPADEPVSGRDLVHGQLRRARVSSHEVGRALEPALRRIIDTIRDVLDETPPQLAADLTEQGITLAGGGSLLNGLPQRLENDLGIPTQRVPNPLTCIAIGAGRCLPELQHLTRKTRPR
jgi:rod shape-determining protein MreB